MLGRPSPAAAAEPVLPSHGRRRRCRLAGRRWQTAGAPLRAASVSRRPPPPGRPARSGQLRLGLDGSRLAVAVADGLGAVAGSGTAAAARAAAAAAETALGGGGRRRSLQATPVREGGARGQPGGRPGRSDHPGPRLGRPRTGGSGWRGSATAPPSCQSPAASLAGAVRPTRRRRRRHRHRGPPGGRVRTRRSPRAHARARRRAGARDRRRGRPVAGRADHGRPVPWPRGSPAARRPRAGPAGRLLPPGLPRRPDDHVVWLSGPVDQSGDGG